MDMTRGDFLKLVAGASALFVIPKSVLATEPKTRTIKLKSLDEIVECFKKYPEAEGWETFPCSTCENVHGWIFMKNRKEKDERAFEHLYDQSALLDNLSSSPEKRKLLERALATDEGQWNLMLVIREQAEGRIKPIPQSPVMRALGENFSEDLKVYDMEDKVTENPYSQR